jgi:hypothetical protein
MKINRLKAVFDRMNLSIKRFFHVEKTCHVFFVVFCILNTVVSFSSSFIMAASYENRATALTREISSINTSSAFSPIGRASIASTTYSYRTGDILLSAVRQIQKSNDSLGIFKIYSNDTQPSYLSFDVDGDANSVIVCDTTKNDANASDLSFCSGISLLSGAFTYSPLVNDIYISSKYADGFISRNGLPDSYSSLVGLSMDVNTLWYSQRSTESFTIRGVYDSACPSFNKLSQQYSNIFVMRMEDTLPIRPALYFETVSDGAYNLAFFQSFFKTFTINDVNSFFHFSFLFFVANSYSTSPVMDNFVAAMESSSLPQSQLFYYLLFFFVFLFLFLIETIFYFMYLREHPCCRDHSTNFFVAIAASFAFSLILFLLFPICPTLSYYQVPSFTQANFVCFVVCSAVVDAFFALLFVRKGRKNSL